MHFQPPPDPVRRRNHPNVVLYLGKLLNSKVGFLRGFNIPEPVTGGLFSSAIFGVFYAFLGLQFEFALDCPLASKLCLRAACNWGFFCF